VDESERERETETKQRTETQRANQELEEKKEELTDQVAVLSRELAKVLKSSLYNDFYIVRILGH
jgi:hypothetical protein